MLETIVIGTLLAGGGALFWRRFDTLEKAVNGGKEKVMEVKADLQVIKGQCPIFKDGCKKE